MSLRRWIAALGLMLITAAPAGAQAEVRAVFVGIDHYANSTTNIDGAKFNDLHGAVADAVLMRDTLNTVFHYGFDAAPGKPCWAPPTDAKSIFLADECATHQVIFDAIDAQINALHAGDTLIVYMAGHGSSIDVIEVLNHGAPASQAGGAYSTFLTVEARRPGDTTLAEILDLEFSNRIDKAKARGINIVQIGDYCNSGTGVRGVSTPEVPRTAPMLLPAKPYEVDMAKLAPPVVATNPGKQGVSVWLGAALDTEKSYEGDVGGTPPQTHGVFTLALAQTLLQHGSASFDDIMTRVRQTVIDQGHSDQHPQGEGEMGAALTPEGLSLAPADARPIDVSRAATGQWTLPYDGALAGMTKGSRLDLYASADGATGRAQVAKVASATITAVDTYSAQLALDPPVPADLPASLFARETSHVAVAAPIRMRVEPILARATPLRPLNQQLMAIIPTIPGVTIGEPASVFLGFYPPDQVYLYDLSGTSLGRIGKMGDPAMAERLTTAIARQARVNELLAQLRMAQTVKPPLLCVTPSPFFSEQCTADVAKKSVLLQPGGAMVTVVNQDTKALYLTVLAIGPDNTIEMVVPQRAGHDLKPIAPGEALQPNVPLAVSTTTGTCRYIAFATAQPFDSALWTQTGLNTMTDGGQRAASPCGSSAEQPGLASASGARDLQLDASHLWSAMRVDATIGKPGNVRKRKQ